MNTHSDLIMEKYEQLDAHILNILQNQDVTEQSDLQTLLSKRGIEVPQATLSRRLKKLGVAKVGGIYTIIDYNQPHLPVVVNMQVSDFGQIILQTHPGCANALAIYLDGRYVSYSPRNNQEKLIMGTLAGDDTVLLITKNKQNLAQVIAQLEADFPYLKSSE